MPDNRTQIRFAQGLIQNDGQRFGVMMRFVEILGDAEIDHENNLFRTEVPLGEAVRLLQKNGIRCRQSNFTIIVTDLGSPESAPKFDFG